MILLRNLAMLNLTTFRIWTQSKSNLTKHSGKSNSKTCHKLISKPICSANSSNWALNFLKTTIKTSFKLLIHHRSGNNPKETSSKHSMHQTKAHNKRQNIIKRSLSKHQNRINTKRSSRSRNSNGYRRRLKKSNKKCRKMK